MKKKYFISDKRIREDLKETRHKFNWDLGLATACVIGLIPPMIPMELKILLLGLSGMFFFAANMGFNHMLFLRQKDYMLKLPELRRQKKKLDEGE